MNQPIKPYMIMQPPVDYTEKIIFTEYKDACEYHYIADIINEVKKEISNHKDFDGNFNLDQLKIYIQNDDDCTTCEIIYFIKIKKDKKTYDQELKQYNKALIKYQDELAEYNIALSIYKIKYEEKVKLKRKQQYEELKKEFESTT